MLMTNDDDAQQQSEDSDIELTYLSRYINFWFFAHTKISVIDASRYKR